MVVLACLVAPVAAGEVVVQRDRGGSIMYELVDMTAIEKKRLAATLRVKLVRAVEAHGAFSRWVVDCRKGEFAAEHAEDLEPFETMPLPESLQRPEPYEGSFSVVRQLCNKARKRGLWRR